MAFLDIRALGAKLNYLKTERFKKLRSKKGDPAVSNHGTVGKKQADFRIIDFAKDEAGDVMETAYVESEISVSERILFHGELYHPEELTQEEINRYRAEQRRAKAQKRMAQQFMSSGWIEHKKKYPWHQRELNTYEQNTLHMVEKLLLHQINTKSEKG